jgi:hypothetical protein
MKISVLLVEDAKQIMLTPENEHEKSALKMIAPGDAIEAVTKWGTFMDREPSHLGYEVGMSQGGVYRAYADENSLMFIVSKKKEVDELPPIAVKKPKKRKNF